MVYSGPNKYGFRQNDEKIKRILGGSVMISPLICASYAESTWCKIYSALMLLDKFQYETKLLITWPLDTNFISAFIHWAIFVKKLAPASVTSYMSHIKVIHKLRGIDHSACENFAFKRHLRGAKNLNFYSVPSMTTKKAMTLSLLNILGHEIALSKWSDHSESVIWTAMCTGFFGSFRMGELLPKNKFTFNKFETLLWTDIKFFADNSVQIHNKIPKTRKEKGEYISLFEFNGHNCCPVTALKTLKKFHDSQILAEKSDCSPVFAFANNSFLTCSMLNTLIFNYLQPHMQSEASFYSCKSFRPALPSALAALPAKGNRKFIKKWGRWDSDAFEKYIRLDHLAKKRIFNKFAVALSLS